MNFPVIIKNYLKTVGRPATVFRADGGTDRFYATVEQTWKRNKTNFDDKTSPAGRVYNEYCEIICPYDINLKAYGRDDIFEIEGERYVLCRSERVTAMGRTQFYRGIIKKMREADASVFS